MVTMSAPGGFVQDALVNRIFVLIGVAMANTGEQRFKMAFSG